MFLLPGEVAAPGIGLPELVEVVLNNEETDSLGLLADATTAELSLRKEGASPLLASILMVSRTGTATSSASSIAAVTSCN